MVSPNVDKILQQTKSLSVEERHQFIELLREELVPETNSSKEDKFIESLLRKGIVRKIPRKPTKEDIERFNMWHPVSVPGRPVSEILIEERR